MKNTLIVLVMSLLGCATTKQGTLGSADKPACEVINPGLLANTKIWVDGNEARLKGLLADRVIARAEGNQLTYLTPVGVKFNAGSVDSSGILTINLLIGKLKSNPIQDGKVVVKGALGSQTFLYEGTCTPEQAALGTVGLWKYQEELQSAD